MFCVQCLGLTEEVLEQREVDFVDIAYDEFPEKYYKEEEVRDAANSCYNSAPFADQSQLTEYLFLAV